MRDPKPPMHDPCCAFCAIVIGEASAQIVARTGKWVAFFPEEPATVGHTLVVPANHVPDIWAVRASELGDLAAAVAIMAHVIREALAPEGLNIVQSNGRVATQTVDHLHVHLVPRMAGDAMGAIWPVKSPALAADETADALTSLRAASERSGL